MEDPEEEKNVAFKIPELPMLLKRLSIVPEIHEEFTKFFVERMIDLAGETTTENALLAAIGGFAWSYEMMHGTSMEEMLGQIRHHGLELIPVFVVDEKIAERMRSKLNEHYKD